jgi:hypothetical protein
MVCVPIGDHEGISIGFAGMFDGTQYIGKERGGLELCGDHVCFDESNETNNPCLPGVDGAGVSAFFTVGWSF